MSIRPWPHRVIQRAVTAPVLRSQRQPGRTHAPRHARQTRSRSAQTLDAAGQVKRQAQSLLGNSVAFDQMSTAVREFGRGGPEVSDPGDLPLLIQVEEAHSRVAVTGIREFQPARRVVAFPDDPLDAQMPVSGETLNVEPHIRGAPANPLPELWRLVRRPARQPGQRRCPSPGPVPRPSRLRRLHARWSCQASYSQRRASPAPTAVLTGPPRQALGTRSPPGRPFGSGPCPWPGR